jgi:hypothetical protein
MKFYVAAASILYFIGAHCVLAMPSDVVISEVLFDSADVSDTGAEYIKIKNTGLNDIILTGWSLYPDGIGYFTFPEFSLVAGGTATIHLRKSGKSDSANLYFDVPSTNMGNSSGSVALFSSTAHNKDTIVSYVRYHKPGSGEQKTWESAAVNAKIWTQGSFVDISNIAKGQVILLADIAKKTSAQGWILKSLTNTQTQKTDKNIVTKSADENAESDLKTHVNASVDGAQKEKFTLFEKNDTGVFNSKNILWLILGSGGGILAGLLFLIFKKIVIKK